MLATIAPVGAGAPPVEDDEPAEAEAADADVVADSSADAVAASSCELSDAVMELTPAVRDDATEDKGALPEEAAPLMLFT